MMPLEDVVVLAARRTPVGSFGGTLAGVTPIGLAATAARAAVADAGIAPDAVGTSVFGHVINTEPRDMYLARVAAMEVGVPETASAMNVNRLCGSGLEAVVSAARALMLGDAEVALAGGAECMSRSPHAVHARRPVRMGDAQAVDMMLGALACPFGTGHMGVTAENVAEEHSVSRADQDAFALESQRRAAAAIAEGRFAREVAPVTIASRRGEAIVERDEHPKATTAEALGGLRPAFAKGGTVTAGNASGINDGAAAVVLSTTEAARAAGAAPRARLLGYAHAGVRPEVMGIGPVPAVEALLERTGLTVGDFDVIESNEAFASQAVAVSRALGLDPARVNPNGGAIALGHPVGATGAILIVKALHELERAGGRRALCTMCIGGGQGIALAFEQV